MSDRGTPGPQAASRPVAVVLGERDAARRRAAQLLAGAGLEVYAAAERHALDGRGVAVDVFVVSGHPSEAARLREIRGLAADHPGAAILVLMPPGARDASARRALLSGATGIVREDAVERALVASVHAMLAGQLAVPSTLSRQIAPKPLSHREKQIMALVLEGLTNQEIARRLFLAESTVKTHVSAAFRKLDAHSRSEAVARLQDPEAGYGLETLALAGPVAV